MKQSIVRSLLVAICLMLVSGTAKADLESDLNAFVDQLGGAATATSPTAFEGQGYRYLNGGRVFVRIPSREVQAFSYRAPNYRAGCGGIDIFGGGFSFLDADELVQVLKDIGSNAVSYAFMLALRTISSQISNTLGENFDWLLKNQGMSFNTCERAQWAVNSALSGEVLGNQTSVCISQRTTNLGESYFEARKNCTAAGSQQEASINSDEARESAFIEGNLVWMIMDKGGFFVGDPEMRELMMSVTGTLVKSKRDDAGNLSPGNESASADVAWYPSLMSSSDDLLEGILRGAEAITVYQCDTDAGTYACQAPTETTLSLPVSSSLVTIVSERMNGLYDAIRNKGVPTVEQTEMVQKTSIPVHRMLAVAAGLRGETGRDLVGKYTEAVAVDILFTYIERITYLIQNYATDPQWGKNGERLAATQSSLLTKLRDRKAQIHRDIDSAMRVAQELQYYERLIISGMPKGLVEAHLWNPGAGGS